MIDLHFVTFRLLQTKIRKCQRDLEEVVLVGTVGRRYPWYHSRVAVGTHQPPTTHHPNSKVQLSISAKIHVNTSGQYSA